MLNTRSEKQNTVFYSYLACFVKIFTFNMYVSMSYTGLIRRNTVFIFLWWRHRNTWISIQYVGSEWVQGKSGSAHGVELCLFREWGEPAQRGLPFTRDSFTPKMSATSQSSRYCLAHLHCSQDCNTIARLMRNIRPLPGFPFGCHTPYQFGNGNIVYRSKRGLVSVRVEPVYSAAGSV